MDLSFLMLFLNVMNYLKRIFFFYFDGFKSMTIGKNLWLIILIKLFIIFLIFRLFFFPDFLDERFDSDQEKSEYVIDQLTNKLP
jgi:hypothetical protein